MADKSIFVTTIKSGEDFDTLLDNLSGLLQHSPTASQPRKFPINWSLPLSQMNMQHCMILLRISPYFTSKSSEYQWNNAQITSHHVNFDFKGSISLLLLMGTMHVMV